MAEPGASGLISCYKGPWTVEPTHENKGKPGDSGLVAGPKGSTTACPTQRPMTASGESEPAGQRKELIIRQNGSGRPISRRTTSGAMITVQSSLRVDGFREGLRDCPDREWVQSILDGIENGERLGPLEGHVQAAPKRCRNGKEARQREDDVRKAAMKDVERGRKLGPFKEPPFEGFVCSPVNLIPKKGTDAFRQIHNLSHPFAGDSVNSLVPDEEATMSYQSFEEFVDMVRRAGPGAELGKFDLTDAFKHVVVHPDYWHLLGLHAGTGAAREYFVETTLPFGHRKSPAIFTRYGKALQCVAGKFGASRMFNYMDDFATAEKPGTGQCGANLKALRAACDLVGFEVQERKVEGPTTCLTVLGIEVDSVKWELRIDPEKRKAILAELEEWAERTMATKREIASLHGRLSFLARVIKPGRTFLRRVVEEMQQGRRMDEGIGLSAEFHAELRWWRQFLPEWDGVSLISDWRWTENCDMDFWTDASGKGFGAFWDGHWIAGDFQGWAKDQSMAFKELYAVVAAVATWGDQWAGRKIRLHCDNMSVCEILRYQNSRRAILAALLRTLYFLCAKAGCLITAEHLGTKENSVADALSRGWLADFFGLRPDADPYPTKITEFSLDFGNPGDCPVGEPSRDNYDEFTYAIHAARARSGYVGPDKVARGEPNEKNGIKYRSEGSKGVHGGTAPGPGAGRQGLRLEAEPFIPKLQTLLVGELEANIYGPPIQNQDGPGAMGAGVPGGGYLFGYLPEDPPGAPWGTDGAIGCWTSDGPRWTSSGAGSGLSSIFMDRINEFQPYLESSHCKTSGLMGVNGAAVNGLQRVPYCY